MVPFVPVHLCLNINSVSCVLLRPRSTYCKDRGKATRRVVFSSRCVFDYFDNQRKLTDNIGKVVDVPSENPGMGESACKKQSAVNQSAAPARDPNVSTSEKNHFLAGRPANPIGEYDVTIKKSAAGVLNHD